jgi:hypothetical protein
LTVFSWLYIVVVQVTGCVVMILLQLFAFGNIKFIKLIAIVQQIVFTIFFRKALQDVGDDYWEGFSKYLSDYGLILLFFMVFTVKN